MDNPPPNQKRKLDAKYGPSSVIQYTFEERKKILKYIIEHKCYHRVKTVTLYKEMAEAKILDRTAQSMWEHFRKQICPYLHTNRFGLTSEEKLKLLRHCQVYSKLSKDEYHRVIRELEKDVRSKKEANEGDRDSASDSGNQIEVCESPNEKENKKENRNDKQIKNEAAITFGSDDEDWQQFVVDYNSDEQNNEQTRKKQPDMRNKLNNIFEFSQNLDDLSSYKNHCTKSPAKKRKYEELQKQSKKSKINPSQGKSTIVDFIKTLNNSNVSTPSKKYKEPSNLSEDSDTDAEFQKYLEYDRQKKSNANTFKKNDDIVSLLSEDSDSDKNEGRHKKSKNIEKNNMSPRALLQLSKKILSSIPQNEKSTSKYINDSDNEIVSTQKEKFKNIDRQKSLSRILARGKVTEDESDLASENERPQKSKKGEYLSKKNAPTASDSDSSSNEQVFNRTPQKSKKHSVITLDDSNSQLDKNSGKNSKSKHLVKNPLSQNSLHRKEVHRKRNNSCSEDSDREEQIRKIPRESPIKHRFIENHRRSPERTLSKKNHKKVAWVKDVCFSSDEESHRKSRSRSKGSKPEKHVTKTSKNSSGRTKVKDSENELVKDCVSTESESNSEKEPFERTLPNQKSRYYSERNETKTSSKQYSPRKSKYLVKNPLSPRLGAKKQTTSKYYEVSESEPSCDELLSRIETQYSQNRTKNSYSEARKNATSKNYEISESEFTEDEEPFSKRLETKSSRNRTKNYQRETEVRRGTMAKNYPVSESKSSEPSSSKSLPKNTKNLLKNSSSSKSSSEFRNETVSNYYEVTESESPDDEPSYKRIESKSSRDKTKNSYGKGTMSKNQVSEDESSHNEPQSKNARKETKNPSESNRKHQKAKYDNVSESETTLDDIPLYKRLECKLSQDKTKNSHSQPEIRKSTSSRKHVVTSDESESNEEQLSKRILSRDKTKNSHRETEVRKNTKSKNYEDSESHDVPLYKKLLRDKTKNSHRELEVRKDSISGSESKSDLSDDEKLYKKMPQINKITNYFHKNKTKSASDRTKKFRKGETGGGKEREITAKIDLVSDVESNSPEFSKRSQIKNCYVLLKDMSNSPRWRQVMKRYQKQNDKRQKSFKSNFSPVIEESCESDNGSEIENKESRRKKNYDDFAGGKTSRHQQTSVDSRDMSSENLPKVKSNLNVRNVSFINRNLSNLADEIQNIIELSDDETMCDIGRESRISLTSDRSSKNITDTKSTQTLIGIGKDKQIIIWNDNDTNKFITKELHPNSKISHDHIINMDDFLYLFFSKKMSDLLNSTCSIYLNNLLKKLEHNKYSLKDGNDVTETYFLQKMSTLSEYLLEQFNSDVLQDFKKVFGDVLIKTATVENIENRRESVNNEDEQVLIEPRNIKTEEDRMQIQIMPDNLNLSTAADRELEFSKRIEKEFFYRNTTEIKISPKELSVVLNPLQENTIPIKNMFTQSSVETENNQLQNHIDDLISSINESIDSINANENKQNPLKLKNNKKSNDLTTTIRIPEKGVSEGLNVSTINSMNTDQSSKIDLTQSPETSNIANKESVACKKLTTPTRVPENNQRCISERLNVSVENSGSIDLAQSPHTTTCGKKEFVIFNSKNNNLKNVKSHNNFMNGKELKVKLFDIKNVSPYKHIIKSSKNNQNNALEHKNKKGTQVKRKRKKPQIKNRILRSAPLRSKRLNPRKITKNLIYESNKNSCGTCSCTIEHVGELLNTAYPNDNNRCTHCGLLRKENENSQNSETEAENSNSQGIELILPDFSEVNERLRLLSGMEKSSKNKTSAVKRNAPETDIPLKIIEKEDLASMELIKCKYFHANLGLINSKKQPSQHENITKVKSISLNQNSSRTVDSKERTNTNLSSISEESFATEASTYENFASKIQGTSINHETAPDKKIESAVNERLIMENERIVEHEILTNNTAASISEKNQNISESNVPLVIVIPRTAESNKKNGTYSEVIKKFSDSNQKIMKETERTLKNKSSAKNTETSISEKNQIVPENNIPLIIVSPRTAESNNINSSKLDKLEFLSGINGRLIERKEQSLETEKLVTKVSISEHNRNLPYVRLEKINPASIPDKNRYISEKNIPLETISPKNAENKKNMEKMKLSTGTKSCTNRPFDWSNYCQPDFSTLYNNLKQQFVVQNKSSSKDIQKSKKKTKTNTLQKDRCRIENIKNLSPKADNLSTQNLKIQSVSKQNEIQVPSVLQTCPNEKMDVAEQKLAESNKTNPNSTDESNACEISKIDLKLEIDNIEIEENQNLFEDFFVENNKIQHKAANVSPINNDFTQENQMECCESQEIPLQDPILYNSSTFDESLTKRSKTEKSFEKSFEVSFVENNKIHHKAANVSTINNDFTLENQMECFDSQEIPLPDLIWYDSSTFDKLNKTKCSKTDKSLPKCSKAEMVKPATSQNFNNTFIPQSNGSKIDFKIKLGGNETKKNILKDQKSENQSIDLPSLDNNMILKNQIEFFDSQELPLQDPIKFGSSTFEDSLPRLRESENNIRKRCEMEAVKPADRQNSANAIKGNGVNVNPLNISLIARKVVSEINKSSGSAQNTADKKKSKMLLLVDKTLFHQSNQNQEIVIQKLGESNLSPIFSDLKSAKTFSSSPLLQTNDTKTAKQSDSTNCFQLENPEPNLILVGKKLPTTESPNLCQNTNQIKRINNISDPSSQNHHSDSQSKKCHKSVTDVNKNVTQELPNESKNIQEHNFTLNGEISRKVSVYDEIDRQLEAMFNSTEDVSLNQKVQSEVVTLSQEVQSEGAKSLEVMNQSEISLDNKKMQKNMKQNEVDAKNSLAPDSQVVQSKVGAKSREVVQRNEISLAEAKKKQTEVGTKSSVAPDSLEVQCEVGKNKSASPANAVYSEVGNITQEVQSKYSRPTENEFQKEIESKLGQFVSKFHQKTKNKLQDKIELDKNIKKITNQNARSYCDRSKLDNSCKATQEISSKNFEKSSDSESNMSFETILSPVTSIRPLSQKNKSPDLFSVQNADKSLSEDIFLTCQSDDNSTTTAPSQTLKKGPRMSEITAKELFLNDLEMENSATENFQSFD